MRVSRLACAVFVAALAAGANAQSVIYNEDFETGGVGWTFDAAVGGCAWAIDGSPAASFALFSCGGLGSPVSQPTVFGGANALNFNNGTDMDYGTATTTGNSATGPLITLSTVVGVTMTMQDFYEMDSCAIPNIHRRFVEWLDASGTVIKVVQLTYADGPDTESSCAPPPLPPAGGTPGNWNDHHMHTFDLSTLSSTTFRLRFRVELDTAAGIETSCTGWFVDDIQIICPLVDASAPTTPALLFPADGACVSSPVPFDWTDSTDTAPCGPGTIDHYDIEIDSAIGFPAPTVISVGVSNVSLFGPPGTFFWRVRAFDATGNASPYSSIFTFDNELPLLPLTPDSLFVNDDTDGAQNGDPGFADPVPDQTPVFSAIFHDPNCSDAAVSLRMQVSTDPTFVTLDFDSGTVALPVPVPIDTRCPDITINVSLNRGTVYFWRILFSDASGASPFSVAQSFRIGDDFEFGVRHGSTHHGRRCWIATAACGSESAPAVERLQAWRSGSLEAVPAGRLASRSYHVVGAIGADGLSRLGFVNVFGSDAGSNGATVVVLLAALVAVAGLVRFRRA
jgi:hypothetical protein